MNKVRTVMIDGIGIRTSLSAIEIANLPKINAELKKKNEKLNHYKLLYQKVKDRNDKAIEYLEQQLEYSKKDCIPARTFTCEKALKILKGNEE